METKTEEQTEKVTTLGEHRGLWLAEDKTVLFKPWKGLQEAEMSEMLQANSHKLEGGKIFKKISLMLSYMCVQIAGHTFWELNDKGTFVERMTQAERERVISDLYEADVMAAFVLMRMACLDDHLTLSINSPYAKDRQCSWTGDLSQMALLGSPSFEESLWGYELLSPAMVRGKEVKSFTMGPIRWGALEQIKIESPGSLDMKTIASCVHAMPDLDKQLGGSVGKYFYERDLYDVTKKDLSRITQGIGDHHVGLSMEIEVFDHEANKPFSTSLPWASPAFFEDFSQ